MREKGVGERGPKAHLKNSDFGTPICLGTLLWLSKLHFGQRKNNKHKEFWRGTSPPFGSQPSRGHVPFVPWKCPICPADILSYQCGITHKPGRDVPARPQTVPVTLLRHTDHQSPLCAFCFLVFFSLALQFEGAIQKNSRRL